MNWFHIEEIIIVSGYSLVLVIQSGQDYQSLNLDPVNRYYPPPSSNISQFKHYPHVGTPMRSEFYHCNGGAQPTD